MWPPATPRLQASMSRCVTHRLLLLLGMMVLTVLLPHTPETGIALVTAQVDPAVSTDTPAVSTDAPTDATLPGAAPPSTAADPPSSPAAAGSTGTSSGWRRGRVTYFGAPESFGLAYDPSRGAGSFGILAYGACGYTNAGGTLPYPQTEYSAAADASPDYPGSCGRCYNIRCTTQPLLGESHT
eukprot:GHRR01036138.1.p1 GENE.GHRR01036138.1~~GHRR01036138.1.p1  ORF type:complete len:183 (-),score=45.32 GHRR01036138.1:187-735(-)